MLKTRYAGQVSTSCAHPRMRSNSVILRNAAGRPEAISLSVKCHDCGEQFKFVGIETTSTVLVSEDRHEVRMLIVAPFDALRRLYPNAEKTPQT
jgi:hypothetical protein